MYAEEEEEIEEQIQPPRFRDPPSIMATTAGATECDHLQAKLIGGCTRFDKEHISTVGAKDIAKEQSVKSHSVDLANRSGNNTGPKDARPKSSKVLIRKNTPAALPKVTPLKSEYSQFSCAG